MWHTISDPGDRSGHKNFITSFCSINTRGLFLQISGSQHTSSWGGEKAVFDLCVALLRSLCGQMGKSSLSLFLPMVLKVLSELWHSSLLWLSLTQEWGFQDQLGLLQAVLLSSLSTTWTVCCSLSLAGGQSLEADRTGKPLPFGLLNLYNVYMLHFSLIKGKADLLVEGHLISCLEDTGNPFSPAGPGLWSCSARDKQLILLSLAGLGLLRAWGGKQHSGLLPPTARKSAVIFAVLCQV